MILKDSDLLSITWQENFQAGKKFPREAVSQIFEYDRRSRDKFLIEKFNINDRFVDLTELNIVE